MAKMQNVYNFIYKQFTKISLSFANIFSHVIPFHILICIVGVTCFKIIYLKWDLPPFWNFYHTGWLIQILSDLFYILLLLKMFFFRFMSTLLWFENFHNVFTRIYWLRTICEQIKQFKDQLRILNFIFRYNSYL